MTAPVVSVVMAAYNGAALIGETIASLQGQRFADFECLIVDDCSTDATREIVGAIDDPRFRLIVSARNQGPVHARNRAFAEARGRYIAGLDQDDLCHPDRFAQQVAWMEANPDTVVLGTAASLFDGASSRAPTLPSVTTPMLVEWMLCILNPLVWSSVMIRGDIARGLDPFTRPELLYAEDFDLYHRLAPHGRIARLDAELLRYRTHSGGASQRFTETMQASAARVLAERHAGLFGPAAPDRAILIVRHVMNRSAIPDRATLALLGETLMALQTDFIDRFAPGPEDLRLIRWETARLWSRIGRAGLRSGNLALGDAVAVRPDHLGLGYAGINELVLSRLIGSARSARRRSA
ncbi:MAG: glycosyl transferase family 2 [Sphingomonas sp. 28-66-16]|nr:MAG: glycosyl transferase family 2 [Sphingomonas sp. 28-66-16]